MLDNVDLEEPDGAAVIADGFGLELGLLPGHAQQGLGTVVTIATLATDINQNLFDRWGPARTISLGLNRAQITRLDAIQG
jgi:hypothetical protein